MRRIFKEIARDFFIGILIAVLTVPNFALANSTTQTEAQRQTQKENEKGAKQAKMMGTLTVALGVAQIYQGYSMLTPPTTAAGYVMIATGTISVLQGVQGLQGAKKMAAHAALAGKNLKQLDSLAKSADDNIKIDPSFMKTGEAGKVLAAFEKSTGIPADGLLNALDKGVDPFDLLAAKGVPKSLLDEAKAKGSAAVAGGAKADTSKYIDQNKINALFDTGEYGAGGAGGGAKSAMAAFTAPNFDDLLNKDDSGPITDTGGVDPNEIGLRPEVERALAQAGVTDLSIFQMVSKQYQARTPSMFGLSKEDVERIEAKAKMAKTEEQL